MELLKSIASPAAAPPLASCVAPTGFLVAPGFPDNPLAPFLHLTRWSASLDTRERLVPRITGDRQPSAPLPSPRKNLADRTATRYFSFIIEASVVESLVINLLLPAAIAALS